MHRVIVAATGLAATIALAGCSSTRTAIRPHALQATSTPPVAMAAVTPVPAVTAPSVGAAKPATRPRHVVAAIVNGESIPLWEYHALLQLNLQTDNARSVASQSAVHARTAQQIVDEELLNEYAARHHLTVPEATIAARVQLYRIQAGGSFGASLTQLGVDMAQFRRIVARNLNAQAVIQHIINAIAAPTARVQVVQVVVPTRPAALQVRADLLRGADAMLEAAGKSSDPATRRSAGQLPALTRAEGTTHFGLAWSTAAFSLAPGAVSTPIAVPGGWAVLHVVERQPATSVMKRTLDTLITELRASARIKSYVK